MTCAVNSPGSLGLHLVIEPETCQAVVKVAPSAAGLVAIQNPGVVQAGDVLEAINGESVATITALDGDGDGAISAGELAAAIKSMGLRDIWLSDSKHAAHAALDDAELAGVILAEYDLDGSGELDGGEIKSFLELILRATIGRIIATPRDPPLQLTFSRPVEHDGRTAKWIAAQTRASKDDGLLYTKNEFLERYGGTTEWDAAETRIAEDDGQAYTRADFVEHYGGTAEWDEAEVRVDRDGCAYTKAEFVEEHGGAREWRSSLRLSSS